MIFSIEGHIEKIKAGDKTQTRRPTDRYQIGKLYAIQPGRGKPGIPDGKIYIRAKREEWKTDVKWLQISPWEANDEGGYTPEEYERLYEKMYPGWEVRWSYLFMYYPTKAIEMMDRGEFPAFMLQGSSRSATT